MSGFVLTDRERLLALEEAERTFPMTEDEFRAFYELTARPVWVYINRMTGDGRLADDLLQEAYYRLLRTKTTFESDDHRKNYLYRIATNLVHDHRRRPRADREPLRERAWRWVKRRKVLMAVTLLVVGFLLGVSLNGAAFAWLEHRRTGEAARP